jgi:hypothetical protein
MDESVSVSELGQRWGAIVSEMMARMIALEKEIDRLRQNEAVLLRRIEEIKKPPEGG